MKRVLERPYAYWIIGIFAVYLILNLIISGFYKTIPLIIKYAETVNWFELIISLSLSIIIGALIAINAVFSFIRYKERRQCKEADVLAGIGTVGGLATGFCPLCAAGLFPLIFGFFGVTFSFALLPLKGIEVQLAVILILSSSLILLSRKRRKRNI